MPNNSIRKKIYFLNKIISTLEWDIPHITNKDLRAQKEAQFNQLKKELEELKKINEENITKLG